MAEFTCTRCGKCCISLGRHMTKERSISQVQHYCRIGISGEIIPVTIAPEYRAIYADGERDDSWCPFLRKNPDETFTCTIYNTRPRICREFRCRTMAIYNSDGQETGTVSGMKILSTDDPELKRLWSELTGTGNITGPGFFERLRRELARHGYRIEPLS
jgi:Fe-S-cluster containining protein